MFSFLRVTSYYRCCTRCCADWQFDEQSAIILVWPIYVFVNQENPDFQGIGFKYSNPDFADIYVLVITVYFLKYTMLRKA